jgi:DNA-binding MarR family transcriptional regulator
MTPNEDCVRRLLTRVASGGPVSQRSLSRELGVALGLTNLLLQRLARKGWIRIVRGRRNRVLYFLTSAGVAEQARMSREYFQRGVGLYAETRDRIRRSFDHLSARTRAGGKVGRIVFFGGGEVAEVGYVVLAETSLQLMAVVDDERTRPFFGVPVHSTARLTADTVAGQPYDVLVVMSFADPAQIQARLSAAGITGDRIHWLDEVAGRTAPGESVDALVAEAAGSMSAAS